MGQMECSNTAGGSFGNTTILKTGLAVSAQVGHLHTLWPSNSPLRCAQQRCKHVFTTRHHKNVHNSTMYESQELELSTCSSTPEWMNRLQLYCSAMRVSGLQTQANIQNVTQKKPEARGHPIELHSNKLQKQAKWTYDASGQNSSSLRGRGRDQEGAGRLRGASNAVSSFVPLVIFTAVGTYNMCTFLHRCYVSRKKFKTTATNNKSCRFQKRAAPWQPESTAGTARQGSRQGHCSAVTVHSSEATGTSLPRGLGVKEEESE